MGSSSDRAGRAGTRRRRRSVAASRRADARAAARVSDGPDQDLAPESGDDWRGVTTSVDAIGVEVARLELVDVVWTRARLTGARLFRMRAVDVVFRDCDLSGALLEVAALTRVEFHDCRMSGLVLAGSTLSDVLVSGCRLDRANFRQITGKALQIKDSDARGVDLAGARVTGLRLQDCQLDGLDVSQAEIPGARLHGSSLGEIRGVAALAGAVIDADQTAAMAMSLLAGSGIVVDDDRGA